MKYMLVLAIDLLDEKLTLENASVNAKSPLQNALIVQCFNSVIRLQKCTHQVSLNAARTS